MRGVNVFDPQLADIRFGFGLSPAVEPPSSVRAMLDRLAGPDEMAKAMPIDSYEDVRLALVDARAEIKQARLEDGAARKARRAMNARFRKQAENWLARLIIRRVNTPDGFRERLAAFWGDHFTVVGKGAPALYFPTAYIESAIRPNINGRFEDLLIAAVSHQMMLQYLDQTRSIGPDSLRAQKSNKTVGLNENLAREILELHTLGVGAPYTQGDVRGFANLLTGLTTTLAKGSYFAPDRSQPGEHTVLGRVYGGDSSSLDDIHAALRDLAVHPATANHLALKLAVHFVSDTPDAGMVKAMASAYSKSGGELSSLYREMLEHPSAWAPKLENIKPPIDFVSSALRALDVPQTSLGRMNSKGVRDRFLRPLTRMGQPWEVPLGPDGWPEEDEVWVSPQGMAARLQWGMLAPRSFMRKLPDPRDFARQALGAHLPDKVAFAAEAAESRWEGIGLVLASPAFQRR